MSFLDVVVLVFLAGLAVLLAAGRPWDKTVRRDPDQPVSFVGRRTRS